MVQFNSVNFVLPNITNYTFTSEGFTICTHTTSLSQDLTSDQEKLPRNREKTFHGGKKGKKPSGEQQKRIPLPGWIEAIHVMCTEGSITELQHNQ